MMFAPFILTWAVLATSCFYQARFDFEPHSKTIINCDGEPIYGVHITDAQGNSYAVTFDEESGDTAQNAISFLGPKQIGYQSTFGGFKPMNTYQIHIGGGDANGYMIIETDSVGDIAKVDNRTPCK
jgi:hypothetical protein